MRLEHYMKERMLAKNDKCILGYQKGCLIVRDSQNKKIIKTNRIHNRIKSVKWFERLLRYEPRIAISVDDMVFWYTDHGAIYEYRIEENIVKKIRSFSKGMNNPLSFCVRRDNDGRVKEVVYGEYIWNTEKGKVSIFRYDFKGWKEVYSFPEKTITHIHNIIYDSYKNRYIVMTGDDDSESAIWDIDEEFKEIHKIVGGSQKYRACMALPNSDGIYYATDTPLEENRLYFYDYKNGLKEICSMPGPCIYGRVYNNILYLATSVEGNPALGKWRYRMSNKLGKGVRDRKVHIFSCDIYGNVQEIGYMIKDKLPMWLFQFGNALFPESTEGIFVCPQSCKEKGTLKVIEV